MEMSVVQFKEQIYDYMTAKFLGDRPVLVDLYTDWCPSCKTMAPSLDTLDKKYQDIDIIKVNISTADDLCNALEVSSVPTLLFFRPKSSTPTKRISGAQPPVMLERLINECLLA